VCSVIFLYRFGQLLVVIPHRIDANSTMMRWFEHEVRVIRHQAIVDSH